MNKFSLRFAMTAALVGLMSSTALQAAPNLVKNGSFENGLTDWTVSRIGGTTPGTGIQVITTGIANSTGYGDFITNDDGTHAAFFVDDNAIESLSQLITLTAGQKYTFSFDAWATASGAANPFGFSLTDAVALTTAFDINTNNGSMTDIMVGAWSNHSYDFTAIYSGSYLLDFTFTSGNTPAKDVVVDNVKVTAVPEPTTWALMVAGIGAIGVSMRRNKRVNQAISFA